MREIDTRGLLLRIFIPTIVLSSCYLLIGHFCNIPHILLFCILGTFILVPIELGIILSRSKREYGAYSLKSALTGQKKMPVRKILIIALIFFGVAGLLSAFIAPIENHIFVEMRAAVLNHLWLPFNNVFRILAFAPVAYVAYKKKNIYISICFHCFCNLFSVINFVLAVLG